jgi:hypothetical protein
VGNYTPPREFAATGSARQYKKDYAELTVWRMSVTAVDLTCIQLALVPVVLPVSGYTQKNVLAAGGDRNALCTDVELNPCPVLFAGLLQSPPMRVADNLPEVAARRIRP